MPMQADAAHITELMKEVKAVVDGEQSSDVATALVGAAIEILQEAADPEHRVEVLGYFKQWVVSTIDSVVQEIENEQKMLLSP